MISGGELRKGVIIEMEGKLYQVIDYQHVKMKRTALAKVKLRDINAGHTIERSFQSTEKLTRARLESRPMQYLYNDGQFFNFMNTETFEQVPVSEDKMGDANLYLKENDVCELMLYGDEVIGVELPLTVDLAVAETEPGFKGDTATGGSKNATLETGLTVQVPLFIETGTRVRVNTDTNQYIERVN